MTFTKLSKKKADTIANGVFLISLGILFYTNSWWPGILISIWAMLATREVLTARFYDLIISSLIFIGLFIVYYLNIEWAVLMPVLFVIGGIYLIFRESFYSTEESETEINDETEKEIEESKHGK